MKGGLAAMMCALRDLAGQANVHVHFVCVSDEESEEVEQRGSDHLVEQGYVGDFAITGEPANMHRHPGQACWPCASRSRARPRTAPRPGWETTRC